MKSREQNSASIFIQCIRKTYNYVKTKIKLSGIFQATEIGKAKDTPRKWIRWSFRIDEPFKLNSNRNCAPLDWLCFIFFREKPTTTDKCLKTITGLINIRRSRHFGSFYSGITSAVKRTFSTADLPVKFTGKSVVSKSLKDVCPS